MSAAGGTEENICSLRVFCILARSGHCTMSGTSSVCASNRISSCWHHITCLRRLSLDDPIALGALAAWGDLRVWLAVIQRPQYGNAGHHDNAALLGGRDQAFHRNLPMLTLRIGRRQRKNINARVAEGSEFAAIAGWNRIVKLAGPAFLVTAGPAQGAHQISKKVPPATCRWRLKVWGRACRARIMLVGLGDCLKGSSGLRTASTPVLPTVPRESFGADLGDAMLRLRCPDRSGLSTDLLPCRPELPLGVIEVGAAAPFVAALRPAVKATGPCPLRCIVRRSTRLPNPADGHASPDHHEVVFAAVTGDHGRTEGEGFRIVGHARD